MEHWQLQEAKNRFSEIVNKALQEGPQVVTRRGKKTVVILSVEQYQRLVKPTVNIVDFFQKSPLRDVDLDLTRKKDSSREVNV
ncbi:MAG: type II toxin-antitoxin system Phd/YefM family antitoxin [Desulfobacterales bacterium]|nr:type II toxin-antitoxin system Phd/YefM family antitoxin [Desulfobacterales bacterium]